MAVLPVATFMLPSKFIISLLGNILVPCAWFAVGSALYAGTHLAALTLRAGGVTT